MDKMVKVAEMTLEGFGPNKVGRDVLENLRGRIVILNPEGEIPTNLGIKEVGVFGARFR